MISPYSTIGITTKHDLTDKEAIVARVVDIVRKLGITVCIDAKHMSGLSCVRGLETLEEDTSVDALIVIGGDGTMLRALHELKNPHTPIISINRGTVGFLAELSVDDLEHTLPTLLQGESILDERMMFSVTVTRDGKEVTSAFALNEAVISQGTIARLLDLRTTVDNEYLASYHADGLIVATPTGSTAYSLAAGGPIVHPRQPAVIVTPINSHSLTQKPIVLSAESVVRVEPISQGKGEHPLSISLTVDGQMYVELQPNDIVTIQKHPEFAVFVRTSESGFFHTLRTKLRWGEGV